MKAKLELQFDDDLEVIGILGYILNTLISETPIDLGLDDDNQEVSVSE